jgi:hypothetical protein
MDTINPKFFILGTHENVEKVLNKLPNKNKLYNNYIHDIKDPFIEYGFFLQKEDEENNSGEFRIIVCPENINQYNINILNNDYFKNIKALIICHDNAVLQYNNIFNTKEIIHIWFDKKMNNINCKDLHYVYSDYNWINRIYFHLDIPFAPATDSYFDINCRIL